MIPIFFEGELVGFSGASAHLLDIGGAYPGLADRPRRQLVGGEHLPRRSSSPSRASGRTRSGSTSSRTSRTPTYNSGDIEAMIAACELAQAALPRAARAATAQETVLGAARRLDRLLGADAAPGDREGAGRRLRDRGRLARRRRAQPRRPAAGQGRRSIDRGRRDRRSTSPARATRCRRATTARTRARPSRR